MGKDINAMLQGMMKELYKELDFSTYKCVPGLLLDVFDYWSEHGDNDTEPTGWDGLFEAGDFLAMLRANHAMFVKVEKYDLAMLLWGCWADEITID